MRISRTGFLQRRVLSLLGIYPWKCGACGVTFLFPRRGQRRDHERQGSERRPLERIESHQA